MLGTGTQLDPYQITTVAEFRAMNDSTAYFKLMNDLDVNDSEWATGWTSVTLSFKEFNGDGHELRNAICTGEFITTGNATNIFKNTTFTNITLYSGYSFCYSSVANISFEKCSLEIHGGYTFFDTNSYWYCLLKECSITLNNLIGRSSKPLLNQLSLERCMVKFNGCKLPAISNGALHRRPDGGGGKIVSSCFLGDLTLQSNLTRDEIYRYGLISRYSSNDPVQRSYFAFTLDKNGYTIAGDYPLISYSGNINSSFYDAELMGHTFAGKTGLSALTTAQCKDKDYLNSIGFVVV